MKRNIFSISLVVIILSGFLFVSCEDDETKTVYNTDIPTLTANPLTISSSGGQYSIPYSVTNSVESGVVYASDDVTWIINVTVGTGAVVITVDENTSEDTRSGNVTIEYAYVEGGTYMAVSEKVAVIQTGTSDPILTIQPNSFVADYNGGNYSFTYSIRNVADNGEVSCHTDVDWISGLDDSNYGTIGFAVAKNDGIDLRTGNIVVEYTYSNTTLTMNVTVVQDHIGAGGGFGGDDGSGPTEMIGTYSAHGTVVGSFVNPATQMDWTLRMFYYDGYEDYDYWVDGISPYMVGKYEENGDHRASAGIYVDSDSTIHMPSQVFSYILDPYYVGFTPCVEVSGGNPLIGSDWPELKFTYNSGSGLWTSDYGVFIGSFNGKGLDSFSAWYLEVVYPSFTLTKKSDSTTLSVDGNGSVRGFSWEDSAFPLIANE